MNKAYECYLLACTIYLGGPQLIKKAKFIAEQLGKQSTNVG